jgi:hypothetical protein
LTKEGQAMQSTTDGSARVGFPHTPSLEFKNDSRGRLPHIFKTAFAIAGFSASLMCSIGMLAVGAALFVGALTGCNQATSANPISTQPTRQTQAEDLKQDQQGTNSRFAEQGVYSINGGGGNVKRDDGRGKITKVQSGADGNVSAEGLEGGGNYFQTNYYALNVGGSTTAGQTGGGASGQSSAANANNTATQSPHQEPKANLTVPIAVGMPGSAPQATGAGAVEGPATTTATNQNDLKTLIAKWRAGTATGDEMTKLGALWQSLTGTKLPAEPPPLQP